MGLSTGRGIMGRGFPGGGGSIPPAGNPDFASIGLAPTYAYALRKVVATYAGSAIRVRRSSDSTESDIGFNADGTLNTTALLAFTGAGDGFVKTWYDQTTRNKPVTSATAARQPRIVASGVVETMQGVPAIRFVAASQHYLQGTLTSTPCPWVVAASWKHATLSLAEIVIDCQSVAPGTIYVAGSGAHTYYAPNGVISNARTSFGSLYLGSATNRPAASADTTLSMNGRQIGGPNNSTVADATRMTLGCGYTLDLAKCFDGWMTEAYLLPDVPAAASPFDGIRATYHGLAVNIDCLGDSITYGQFVDRGYEYPAQLSAMNSARFCDNRGYPGITADGIITTKLPTIRAASAIPEIFVILVGTNDLRDGLSGVDMVAQWTTIAADLMSKGARGVVFMTVINRIFPGDGYNQKQYANNWLRTTPPPGTLGVVDLDLVPELSDYNDMTYFQPDHVHLTELGYGAVATAVNAKLVSLGY